MRFMLLLKGDPPEGAMPGEDLIGAMLAYDEELAKAGVLLASEGLHSSSRGARVVYSAGKRTVIDGPFTEAKELVAGFLLIQAGSKEEAIEWAKRCPVDVALKQFAANPDVEPSSRCGRWRRWTRSRPPRTSSGRRRAACANRRWAGELAPRYVLLRRL